jgi:HEPN domain-containing protein
VVYCSQMTVEHSTKAVLLALGFHFPRQHDVSDALLRLVPRQDVPDSFRARVGRISDVVARLSEQRGLASYGFEQGVGVEYFRDFAPEALGEAQQVHAWCREALDEILTVRASGN